MAGKWLFISILLYCIAFILLFPGYRYTLDVDATGYINAARQLAEGNFQQGMNGFWSPLSSWILVPFIKLGIDPVLACKFINALLGIFSLLVIHSLAGKMMMEENVRRVILFTAIPILIYFTFFELCADFLLVFILLIYLSLVFSRDLIQNKKKIFLCALVGALAYYAKNYAFYFIAIHFACTVLILLKGEKTWLSRSLRTFGFFLLVMLLLIVPWWIGISNKYGGFTTGNAGRSNFAWQLLPAKEHQRILITAPPYPGGSSDWDDPSYRGSNKISPFSDKETFLHELRIVGYNTKELLFIWQRFSVFSILLLLISFYFLWIRGSTFKAERNHKIFLLFIAILPLGYLPLIIQPRYIWTTEIGILLLAGVCITALYTIGRIPKNWLLPLAIITGSSFFYYPLTVLSEKKNKGKEEYNMAKALGENKIHGKMMSNWKLPGSKSRSQVICFLNGDQCYGPGTADFTDEEILQAIKDNHIDYYLFYFKNDTEKQEVLNSPIWNASSRKYDEIYPGILVVGFK
ncbi:MAG TPA: hypothetical protein VLJ68_11740 [Chitinophagaceae bacterium]|nr:hypothetical protein [Chitinophagaceae bacterium]